MNIETGRKDDKGKIRMDLLPFECLDEVAKILTFGAEKYSPDGWQKVENGKERYEAALLRHFSAYKQGEQNDPESGFSHLAHVATNALFLIWFEKQSTGETKSENNIVVDEDTINDIKKLNSWFSVGGFIGDINDADKTFTLTDDSISGVGLRCTRFIHGMTDNFISRKADGFRHVVFYTYQDGIYTAQTIL